MIQPVDAVLGVLRRTVVLGVPCLPFSQSTRPVADVRLVVCSVLVLWSVTGLQKIHQVFTQLSELKLERVEAGKSCSSVVELAFP